MAMLAVAPVVGVGDPGEARRLAAVRRYDVLDSAPDGAFERVTALAALLFASPSPL